MFAFLGWFYGKFPPELLKYKTNVLHKWWQEGFELHQEMNKVVE